VRIAILFVAGVAGMLVVRQQFVPSSFGDLGHYRADAVSEIAALPIQYAGALACAECHTDEAEVKARSYHRTLSCEGCHGPAAAHIEDPGEHLPFVPSERGACLYCHAYLPSRPTGFPQVIERLHNPLDRCMTCHDPHDPTPPQVPGTCAACHGLIASTKSISHHRSLECETCHETDAAHKQSPRSFLPKKPSQRQFCGQCHGEGAEAPSGIPRVDVSSHGGRYLCWQCHYPHFPEGR